MERRMSTVEFITDCLAGVQIRLLGSCNGVTRQQLLWRPAPHANNIGFVLWHVARGEDVTGSRLFGETPLWVSEKWHERFEQPADAPDPGDTLGLRAVNIPEMDVLTGYLGAVHERTLKYLRRLPEDGLQEVPDPSRPGRTMAASLRHLITHKNHHQGQIDFIRGLQDDVWDLPAGTGVVLTP
jgi:uncharacterized damage-inducible protein DinB